jgi:biopolymer transport protein ExbD
MKTRKTFGGEGEVTEINISPLIDMVFILLIFFIVTTVFVEERGIGLNKPDAVSPQPIEKDMIVLRLTNSGQVFHEGRDIGLNGVRAQVRRMIQREQLPVIVRAQPNVPAGLMVRVIDEARVAGARDISIAEEQG